MNKIFLIGNLTRDPELTETNSGVAVCKFSIAVNRNYAGADGERKTDFFNCIAWRGLGENVAKYVKKGNKICVIGSIESRNYTDNDGVKRTAIDVVASDVEFLTSKQTESHENSTGNTQERTGAFGGVKLQEIDDDSDIPF